MQRALIILGVAALAVAGCGSDDEEASSDAASTAATVEATAEAADDTGAPGVRAEGGWVRQSAMGQTLGAVYVQLASAVDDRLVAVSVPTGVAAEAQIHEVVPVEVAESGEMSASATGEMPEMMMRELEDGLPLPAGETVMLQPGGYHIMLIDLAAPLEIGQEIDVTLEFEQADPITITVEVAESAP
jgi:copper(I)-binding protein